MKPKKLSARKIMELISEGDLKPQHVGKHTIETLEQTQKSLFNSFNPKTMTKREIKTFFDKLLSIFVSVQELPQSLKQETLCKRIYANLQLHVNVVDYDKDRALVGAIAEMSQKIIKDCECTESQK